MSGVPPQWAYSQTFGHYWYIAAQDEIVLLDGRRFPRPPNIPREPLLQACPQDFASRFSYSGSPPRDVRYVTTSTGATSNNPGQYSSGQRQQVSATRQSAQPTQPAPETIARTPGAASVRSAGNTQGQPRANADELWQHMGVLDVGSAQRNLEAEEIPQPVKVTKRVDRTGEFVSTWDSRSEVRTLRQMGPPEKITDPYLLNNNIFARQMLLGTEEEEERLFGSFKKPQHPSRFFTVGKVFLVLWVEPAGESATVVSYLQVGETTGRFGERVFSKVRRFVVIREQQGYCSALPITTYGRRGVSKPGVIKSEHAIIHTGRQAPEPLAAELAKRGESGMRSRPIRVDTDERGEMLDPLSRVDFGKITTIQHNLKVKSFGKVNRASMDALEQQAKNVWAKVPDAGSLPLPSSVPSVTSGPSTSSSRPAGANSRPRDSGLGLQGAQERPDSSKDDDEQEASDSDSDADSDDEAPQTSSPKQSAAVPATSRSIRSNSMAAPARRASEQTGSAAQTAHSRDTVRVATRTSSSGHVSRHTATAGSISQSSGDPARTASRNTGGTISKPPPRSGGPNASSGPGSGSARKSA